MALTFTSLNQFRNEYETIFEPPPRSTTKLVYFIGGPYDLRKEVVGLETKSVDFIIQDYDYMYRSSPDPMVNITKRGVYLLMPIAFSHADNMEVWVGIPQ